MFCLHRALRKIHMWKLFACGKIKSGRRKKKKKKKGSKKREKVSFCQEKKKNNLWKRLVLAELHAAVNGFSSLRSQTKKRAFLIHWSRWALGELSASNFERRNYKNICSQRLTWICTSKKLSFLFAVDKWQLMTVEENIFYWTIKLYAAVGINISLTSYRDQTTKIFDNFYLAKR